MAHPDDTGAEGSPEGPYRLTGLIATSWRFYRARLNVLVPIFLVVNVSFLGFALIFFLDIPETTGRILAAILTVLQTVALSLAFGLTALIQERYLADQDVGAKVAWQDMKPVFKGAIASAMLSALLLIGVAQIMPPLTIMLQPLFYGPPMIMQIVVIERKGSLAEAWYAAKVFMRGHWARVLTYLMTISLAIYLLINLVLSVLAILLENSSDDAIRAALNLILVIVLAVAYPFLATANWVAYADIAALDDSYQPPARPQRTRRNAGTRTNRHEEPEAIEAEVVSSETTGPTREPTHYETLGVRPTATQKQIRRAFETRVRLLDPDRHADAPEGSRQEMRDSLAKAEEAYRVLSDPELRDDYNGSLR